MWEMLLGIVIVLCVFFGAWPWLMDKLAYVLMKVCTVIKCNGPHGLKFGDSVMIVDNTGLPIFEKNPWFRVVSTPTNSTLMLSQYPEDHEV